MAVPSESEATGCGEGWLQACRGGIEDIGGTGVGGSREGCQGVAR